MDPELLQLFMAAKANNKNVSGLLNNLDSPIFAFLAGAYDPLAGGSAGGPLWAQYSSNPDPVIQDIIGKIQGGADPFYLNSYIEAMPDVSSTGFQRSDLQGLAKGLQKEFSQGGSADKQFTDAGIRSPLDVYSTMDVPLQGKAREDVSKIRSGRASAEERLGEAQSATAAARKDNVLSKDLREELARTLVGTTTGGANRQAKQLAEWLKTQDMLTEDTFRSKAESLAPDQRFESIPFSRAADTVGKQIKKRGSSAPKIDKFKKAQEVEGLAQQQVNAGAADEEAYRRGVLKAYTESGRTPTRDSLAALLRFGAGQSNA